MFKKIKNWFLKRILKKYVDKFFGSDMKKTKKWYRSRTVWTAIITMVLGGIEGVSMALGSPVTIPAFVFEILIGMGLYALRTGDKKIK